MAKKIYIDDIRKDAIVPLSFSHTEPLKIITGLGISLLLFSSPIIAQKKEEQGTSESNEPSASDPNSSDTQSPFFDPDAPEEETREPSAEANAALDMIDKALKEIDETIEREGNTWQFQIDETQILVVTDPLAERMRIMVPIIEAETLNTEILERLMQANFDSALDARYAIANGILWGTYIHPLTGLEEGQFLSGLGQTISIVQTFGTSFSSGAVVFGGGDSQDIIDDQIEEQEKEREAASIT